MEQQANVEKALKSKQAYDGGGGVACKVKLEKVPKCGQCKSEIASEFAVIGYIVC